MGGNIKTTKHDASTQRGEIAMSYNLDTDYNLRISQAAGLAETELLRQGE